MPYARGGGGAILRDKLYKDLIILYRYILTIFGPLFHTGTCFSPLRSLFARHYVNVLYFRGRFVFSDAMQFRSNEQCDGLCFVSVSCSNPRRLQTSPNTMTSYQTKPNENRVVLDESLAIAHVCLSK